MRQRPLGAAMGGMKKLKEHARDQFGVVSRAQVVEALGGNSSIKWKVTTGA
jgi:hypothetical protein